MDPEAGATVFEVWHHHGPTDDTDNDKCLGIFSSRHRAELRIARALTEPGFADHPNGFRVDEVLVDEDHWVGGFVEIDSDRWVAEGWGAARPSVADPVADGEA